jgi:hypothetical protein
MIEIRFFNVSKNTKSKINKIFIWGYKSKIDLHFFGMVKKWFNHKVHTEMMSAGLRAISWGGLWMQMFGG